MYPFILSSSWFYPKLSFYQQQTHNNFLREDVEGTFLGQSNLPEQNYPHNPLITTGVNPLLLFSSVLGIMHTWSSNNFPKKNFSQMPLTVVCLSERNLMRENVNKLQTKYLDTWKASMHFKSNLDEVCIHCHQIAECFILW